MDLNPELLALFFEGQVRIVSRNKKHIYRGEIMKIEVIDNDLHIVFNWLAKGDPFPPFTKRWIAEMDPKPCIVSFENYSIECVRKDLICLRSVISNEEISLYPKESSQVIDPSIVEGLVMSQ